MVQNGVQIAVDLLDFGARLRAQRHRRENPSATEDEVARVVSAWLTDRRHAALGDGVGKAISWPRTP